MGGLLVQYLLDFLHVGHSLCGYSAKFVKVFYSCNLSYDNYASMEARFSNLALYTTLCKVTLHLVRLPFPYQIFVAKLCVAALHTEEGQLTG